MESDKVESTIGDVYSNMFNINKKSQSEKVSYDPPKPDNNDPVSYPMMCWLAGLLNQFTQPNVRADFLASRIVTLSEREGRHLLQGIDNLNAEINPPWKNEFQKNQYVLAEDLLRSLLMHKEEEYIPKGGVSTISREN